MKMSFDANLRRDILKLLCVLIVISGAVGLFLVNPALSTPTLLSIVVSMLLSPWVAALERRGYPRALSITILFLLGGFVMAAGGFAALRSVDTEWASFKANAPVYFQSSIQKLRELEISAKERFPFLSSAHPTDALVEWGRDTGKWFVTNGPKLMGDLISWMFLVPILTFVMLNDGRMMRRRVFQLVPNRFFETTFLMTHAISTALSDYLRAKLVEALLVGVMTTIGLAIVGAPYSIVLGVVAGVTNIIPYAGPVIGAVPGIMIVMLDPSHSHLVWPVTLVYSIANIIDMVVIFPVIVAKLVNLHPLLLIAVVIVGQQYYGLIGMLISIPIATAVKVVLIEIYSAVYEQKGARKRVPTDSIHYETPLLRPE